MSDGMPTGEDSMDDLEGGYGEPTATGPTIEENSNNTGGSAGGGLNDGTADANSTPKAPTAQMRFDILESAREHYMAYA